jgi:hypothetical protein
MKYSLLFFLNFVSLGLGTVVLTTFGFGQGAIAQTQDSTVSQQQLETISYYPKSASTSSTSTKASGKPLSFKPNTLFPSTEVSTVEPSSQLGRSPSQSSQPSPRLTGAPRPTEDPSPVTSLTIAPDKALDPLFVGDTNSLVAKAVGSAEGTRTPKGDRTYAYRGHVDPGNKVWNLGTFSYQHHATSPEDADRRQIQRLRHQASQMQAKAAAYNIHLNLEEILNGIDLANQAPKAVLDRNGYIDWLVRAHRLGKRDQDAIVWARTYAFRNPQTHRWDAPGLGNTKDSIMRDQQRRMLAVADAIAHAQARPDAQTRDSWQTASAASETMTAPQGQHQGIARRVAEQVKDLFSHNTNDGQAVSESPVIDQILNFDLSDLVSS